MIQIKGQITVQFNIGDYTDFISPEDFIYMEIKENAGGLRPLISLSFQLDNEKIIPYLNKGNILYLMYGVDSLTSDVYQFELIGDVKSKQLSLGSEVTLFGAMYNPAFTSYTKSTVYSNCKSFEALQQIADNNGLKLVTNVTRSNDLQTWEQSGKTDWQMLKFIWQRSYKDEDTFFAYALDNNNIYFYDVKQQLYNGPTWILSTMTMGKSEKCNVVNIAGYQIDQTNSGTLTDIVGKNVTTTGYNVDTGEFSTPKHNLKTFTTIRTNKLNMNTTGCQQYNYMVTTGQEHENSLLAQNQNIRNNLLYSCYNCYVAVPGQYRDFRLLDCVQLMPGDSDTDALGYYLITGISKVIRDNLYQNVLLLSREGANGIKGDLLDEGA